MIKISNLILIVWAMSCDWATLGETATEPSFLSIPSKHLFTKLKSISNSLDFPNKFVASDETKCFVNIFDERNSIFLLNSYGLWNMRHTRLWLLTQCFILSAFKVFACVLCPSLHSIYCRPSKCHINWIMAHTMR